ncbi:MAG: hypothetical protein U0572_13785 [Phycisphaerales bacterium]
MSTHGAEDAARRAAALLRDGRAKSLDEAIAIAAERAGLAASEVAVADVRRHAQAMLMQELGDDGYRRHVADVLTRAEEAMTLLSTLPDEPATSLVGRAVRGEVDADPRCRIRVWTDADIGDIAAMFVAAGYAEPEFATVETRWGRLAQLVVDDDGVELRVTRCPPNARVPRDVSLTTKHAVPSASIDEVRTAIERLRRAGR